MKNILLVIDIQNEFIVNEMTRKTLQNIEWLLQTDLFDTVIPTKTDHIVESRQYSSVNDTLIETLKNLNNGILPEYIFLAGVDTECSVLSSAIDFFKLGIRPIILSSYCGSSEGEIYHHAGILSLRHLIGEKNIHNGIIQSKADIEEAVKKIHIHHNYQAAQSGTKEERLVHHLTKLGMHIAFAESCTGGLAASRLINVASASNVINGSVVTYSNETKMHFLHVPEDMLNKHGAVSEKVGAAMAEGTARKFQSEIGVGISGIAGPGGAVPGKPVGMVCFGFTVSGHTWSCTRYFGDIGRNNVRYAAVEFVYDELLRYVETELI